ncbi:hypothetical protein IMCC26207_105112 [Actinobacteria bacterium IMCC26207]|nr:hypothetical protein IMCC26207_105112 [Actinobacteria bacterium IMCC26207]
MVPTEGPDLKRSGFGARCGLVLRAGGAELILRPAVTAPIVRCVVGPIDRAVK